MKRNPFSWVHLMASVVLLAGNLFSLEAASIDLDLRTPNPPTSHINFGAYGNNMYVFVAGEGNGGQIVTTTDLINWDVDYRGPQLTWNSWRSVVYGGGRFVIAAESGTVLTSPDGTTWTEQSVSTSLSFLAITHGGGRYVAVGEDGVTATSTDSVNWTTSDTGDDNWYWGVAFGDNKFVAVSGNNTIVTTTDGISWSPQALPDGTPEGWLNDVAWLGNQFIAVGGRDDGGLMLTSPDGIVWTLVTHSNLDFGGWLNGVTHDGTRFVAVGSADFTAGVVLTSANAVDWSYFETPISSNHKGVFHDGTQTIVTGLNGVVATSTDLATWTRRGDQMLRPASILDIAYADGTYKVVGEQGLIASATDASNWSILPSPSSGFVRSLAYGNGKWVAANISNQKFPILLDSEGTWIAASTPIGVDATRSVAFGAGVFIAIATTGPDTFITSTDGATWTAVNTPGLGPYDEVVYDGGTFLAWRNPPAILNDMTPLIIAVSTDGQMWTERDTGMAAAAAYGAEHANGRWILVGRNWNVMESPDLMSWTQQSLVFDHIRRLNEGQPVAGSQQDVLFFDGQWVIVGDSHTLWTAQEESTLNWQQTFHTGQGSNLNKFLKIVADANGFVIAGESPYWDPNSLDTMTLGEIYQSALNATLPPSLGILTGPGADQVQLLIQGNVGQSYDILFNMTLPTPANNWQLLNTLLYDAETPPYVYTIPGGQDAGMFQLRETP